MTTPSTTPDPTVHPIVRAIHSHAVGYTSAALAIIGVVAPLISPAVQHQLADPTTRNSAVVGLVIAILGALNGKGFFAPKADDTVPS